MLRKCLPWFDRTGDDDKLLWDQGLKPHVAGEFSISVVQANATLEDQGQVVSCPFATFIGVYDGHAGSDASRFVNARLFSHFNRFATEQKMVSSDVLKKAFAATEQEFINLVEEAWVVKPQLASIGTCCLAGAISGDTLYVANLGDSRAVLGRYGNRNRLEMVAERLTDDHNASEEEIRRELIQQHPEDPDIVIHARGSWRVKGIIEVTRAIGDVYLKKPEYSFSPAFKYCVSPDNPLKEAVISAIPSIRARRLGILDAFLIFASDGLWAYLSDQAAVDIVFKNPREGIAKRLVAAALVEASKRMRTDYNGLKGVERGARRRYHDDITVIVVFVDNRSQGVFTPSFEPGMYDSTSTPADIFSLTHHGPDSRLNPEP